MTHLYLTYDTIANTQQANSLAQISVSIVPPKIVENETSPNLVQVDEFGQLRLHCKVISEPQSQILWRREDGKSLDGLEQRFRHHIDRRPHQVVSIDSGELLFNAIRRDQAGAYLVSQHSKRTNNILALSRRPRCPV